MAEKLNERTKTILNFVINEYITTGEPVGSRTIVKKYGLNLSPATIRNIMADLEDLGFLIQPYVSAGRIPTPKGLRYYVDSLLKVKEISDDIKIKIIQAIKNEEFKFPNLLNKVSDIIAEITDYIGIVIAPNIRQSLLKHIEFVKLTSTKILVVIVNELGQIQNKIIEIDFDISQEDLNKLSNFVNDKFEEKDFNEIKFKMMEELGNIKNEFNNKITELIDKFSKLKWEELEQNKDIIVKGLKKVFESENFDKDIESLKKLLTLFEEKNKLLSIIEKSITSPGIQIFIGSNNELFENLSIVTSTYSKDGIVLGSLGVIGPLRMKYDNVIPIVDCAAQIITSILNEDFRRLT